MDRPASRRWLLPLGIISWLAMFLWANVPPYRGNVLEEKRSFFVWHWQLYSRGGEGICDVRYFDMDQDGAPIERWTLLGHERPGLLPDKFARTTKEELFTDYRRVCAAQRKATGKAPHLEVEARCAANGKWKRVESRKRDVCQAAKTKAAAPSKGKTPRGGK